MARPFTRRQALENARFLAVLAETGNVRLAAREVRRAHSTMFERRSGHAGFAQRWEAALASAHARFHLAGAKRAPRHARDDREGKAGSRRSARDDGRGLRTKGGEPVVVRTRSGKLQLRPAHANKLTKAAEQAFLSALSATANIRLSAAAAGASARAFYRRREQSPAFAREMRIALKIGYDALEAAALQAALAGSHEDDGWRHSEPPPIPPMTADQALQLLCLHQKSVRQGWEQPHRRRRRGECDETYRIRLAAMWTAEKRSEAEDEAVARAIRYEESGDWRFAEEQPPPALPPLHLVTGWSRADPKKKPHNPKIAMFGGWRIGEMKLSRRSGTSTGARRKLGER
jgi:hypothetical protein